jgi:hypothetical protein
MVEAPVVNFPSELTGDCQCDDRESMELGEFFPEIFGNF